MRILSCDGLTLLSPLSPKIDHNQSSPCNTYALEHGAVMRITDMITQILQQLLPATLIGNVKGQQIDNTI